MTIPLGDTGSRIHQSRIRLRYTWWMGEVGSRFYRELRDHRKIWGIKCPECTWVFVPPKANCPKCFARMQEWVELSDRGRLLTYTIVRYPVPNIQPLEPPYAMGLIKLDGADTGLAHLLGEVDVDRLRVGMRVQAVFREERTGNLLDIKHFKPV